ncbi:MAG: carbohydrate ABC transporter permease [Clostridia bacterium]|nr:carbohydrate ABC transporter permease [Clostridia bacterium]
MYAEKRWDLRPQKKKIRLTAFDILLYALMFVFLILLLYPFWFVVIGSLSDGRDYNAGGVFLLPRSWSLSSYKVVFSDPELYVAFGVTLARTAVGTVTSLLFTAMVAYAMHSKDLIAKPVFYWFNIFTMFFGGGLIPFFLLIVNLGLYDTFWVYVIPGLYSVYNMIIISTFYHGISSELREAAMIDGASEFTVFLRIYIPLSKPVLATVGMWIAVGHWNSYYDTMLYTVDKSLHTLQYYLMRLILLSSAPSSTSNLPPEILNDTIPVTISYASIVIASIPVIMLYPVIQKICFSQGITAGSVKG